MVKELAVNLFIFITTLITQKVVTDVKVFLLYLGLPLSVSRGDMHRPLSMLEISPKQERGNNIFAIEP